MPAARLGRAATFAFGAAVATASAGSLLGCGGGQAYGGPPDTGVDAAEAVDSSMSPDAFGGGFDAAYGGPPIDAADDDGGTVDGGVPGAIDASNTDAGGPMNLYGGAPP